MSFLAGGLQAGIRRATSQASALVVLVVVLVGSIAAPARARAAPGRPPISLGPTTNTGGGARAGVRSAPPTGQALAGTLDQMTGLTPAQVQLQDVCPAVAPGMAQCAAEARRHRRTRAATRDSPRWLGTRYAGARLGVPHRRRTRWSSAAMQRRDHVARQRNAAPPQRRRRHGACGRSNGQRLRA